MTDSSTEWACRVCGSLVAEAELPPFLVALARAGTSPFCATCREDIEEEEHHHGRLGRPDPERATERRLARSGVPQLLADARLDSVDAVGDRGAVVAACRRWAVRGGTRGLYLHGEVGTGKSTLAAAALAAMCEHREVRWTSSPALMVRLTADFGSAAREGAMTALLSEHPLVLDDLGHERRNETARSVLFAAIDERLVRGIPVLITSNFTPSQLGDHYGAWLASRLVGACDPYRVLGPDRRLT